MLFPKLAGKKVALNVGADEPDVDAVLDAATILNCRESIA